MNRHQQTIADLERANEPNTGVIVAGAVLTIAAVACTLLFAFTI